MNFQVELTSYCDLTCGYCPNKDMQRERAFMSDKVWEAILHRYVVPYRHRNMYCLPTFIGHKDGEPLLNRKFPDRLRDLACAAPDMKVDIYSHGLMLPRLAAQGRDFMEFLATLPVQVRYMMSYHPRNHDDTHNDYAPVVEYLSRVLLDPPRNVEFITVSHKSKWVTQDMQDRWRTVWAGLPITVHANCSINPWTGRMEEHATCKYNGCPYADFGHWFFGATGKVVACCLDLEEEIVLGDVLRDDPEEVFHRTSAFYAGQQRILTEVHGNPNVNPAVLVAHQVCADCYGGKRVDIVQLGVPV